MTTNRTSSQNLDFKTWKKRLLWLRHDALVELQRINPVSLRKKYRIKWYYLLALAHFENYKLSTSKETLGMTLAYAIDLQKELGKRKPKRKHYHVLIEAMLWSRANSNHQIEMVILEALDFYPKDVYLIKFREQVQYRKDI